MKIQIKAMTPGLWEDLEQLFGEKGACGGYRKRGVSVELLRAAVQALAEDGERVVEGYPVKPTRPGNKNIPGAFIFTGTIPLFEKQGFVLAGTPLTSKLRYRKVLPPVGMSSCSSDRS